MTTIEKQAAKYLASLNVFLREYTVFSESKFVAKYKKIKLEAMIEKIQNIDNEIKRYIGG